MRISQFSYFLSPILERPYEVDNWMAPDLSNAFTLVPKLTGPVLKPWAATIVAVMLRLLWDGEIPSGLAIYTVT